MAMSSHVYMLRSHINIGQAVIDLQPSNYVNESNVVTSRISCAKILKAFYVDADKAHSVA